MKALKIEIRKGRRYDSYVLLVNGRYVRASKPGLTHESLMYEIGTKILDLARASGEDI